MAVWLSLDNEKFVGDGATLLSDVVQIFVYYWLKSWWTIDIFQNVLMVHKLFIVDDAVNSLRVVIF